MHNFSYFTNEVQSEKTTTDDMHCLDHMALKTSDWFVDEQPCIFYELYGKMFWFSKI